MFKNALHVPVKQVHTEFEAATYTTKVKQILEDQETLDQMRFFFLAMTTFADTTLEGFEITSETATYSQDLFL